MEKIKMYTLRALVAQYEIEFRENSRVFSKTENKGGTIYRGGYGLRKEEVETEMDNVYQIHNMDIGYFDLHNAEGWKDAYKRNGYEVEIITE